MAGGSKRDGSDLVVVAVSLTLADIVAAMLPRTAELWAKQNQHDGDRLRLFSSVADAVDASAVLYPGSYVDVAASFVFPSVTYVDVDKRAYRFFADTDGVAEIIAAHRSGPERDGETPAVRFIAADYRDDLDIDDQSVDLLVSLYAGFISEHCTRYLRVGGHLLVNPSHGDAAMASIDARYRLAAVIKSRGADGYRVSTDDLGTYLIPKKPQTITVDTLHQLGRGIGYTKAPFAYLFQRVA